MGMRVAIEAKSKHRLAVLDFSDPSATADDGRLSLDGLLTKAAQQNSTGLPLYVFIDANVASTPDANNGELLSLLNEHRKTAAVAALFVTHDSPLPPRPRKRH